MGREWGAKKGEGGMENEDRTEKKGRVTRVKVIDEEVRGGEERRVGESAVSWLLYLSCAEEAARRS